MVTEEPTITIPISLLGEIFFDINMALYPMTDENGGLVSKLEMDRDIKIIYLNEAIEKMEKIVSRETLVEMCHHIIH